MTSVLQDKLAENWMRLYESTVFADTDAATVQSVFADLVACYTEPSRFYHTLEHIHDMLFHFDAITKKSDVPFEPDFEAIGALATWFHDVIYDTQVNDNEEKSATYAANALARLQVRPAIIARVQTLILATKTHQATVADPTCQILLDSDLAILGADTLRYTAYAKTIRQEYEWVPVEKYRTGRAEVLENFLQRPHIYFTPYMQRFAESIARANIQSELVWLKDNNNSFGFDISGI